MCGLLDQYTVVDYGERPDAAEAANRIGLCRRDDLLLKAER